MKRSTILAAVLVALLTAGATEAATLSLGRTAATVGALMTCNASRLGRIGYNTVDGELYVCNGTANVPAGQAASTLVPAGSVTAGVTAVDKAMGGYHQTVFTLTAVAVTMTDAAAAGSHGTIQLIDYPSALVTLLGASSDLAVTEAAAGISDTAAIVCAVGSAVTATDNATLVGTGEATTIPSTAATLTASAGACDGQMTTALLAIEDGTATARDAYLNFAIPDADSSATGALAVSGTVTISYILSGDN